ncbi:hypothetical protein [Odoribacter lunatus]|uniref:hypothetical protein n=1 Tax=Odoribacter lunatus TaxID=2941335 RepID=UPI00203EBC12|nr:hypothetical protein [Odoribacter lunatus]
MRLILVLILTLSCLHIVNAQEADTTVYFQHLNIFEELNQNCPQNGSVKIKGIPAINELINLRTTINKETGYVVGYRIQIFSGSSYDHSIEKLQVLKENFEDAFPGIPAYLNYFDPDFKIRVGNFRNRLDCIPVLKRIRRKYPSCYPVKTEIPLNDLDRLTQKSRSEEE